MDTAPAFASLANNKGFEIWQKFGYTPFDHAGIQPAYNSPFAVIHLNSDKGRVGEVRAANLPGKRCLLTPIPNPSFEQESLAVWALLQNELDALGTLEPVDDEDPDQHPPKSSDKATMSPSTQVKIGNLRRLRRESIKGEKVTISKTAACDITGPSPNTVKLHMPGLWVNWDDPNYDPSSKSSIPSK